MDPHRKSQLEMLIRCLLSLAVVILLGSGCATRSNYEQILNSWLGAPAERLVERWGAPISTFRTPNGNEIYVYDFQYSGAVAAPMQVQQTPGMFVGNTYFPGQTTVTGGQVIPFHRSCRTEFMVDQTATTVRWRYEGNACVAKAPKGPRFTAVPVTDVASPTPSLDEVRESGWRTCLATPVSEWDSYCHRLQQLENRK